MKGKKRPLPGQDDEYSAKREKTDERACHQCGEVGVWRDSAGNPLTCRAVILLEPALNASAGRQRGINVVNAALWSNTFSESARKSRRNGRTSKETCPRQNVSTPLTQLTSGWFCLSNPKVTKHLIAAIGTETYVTLPKGQLIPTAKRHLDQGGSAPLVPGGGHVLVRSHSCHN
jgi:hypothetical protein